MLRIRCYHHIICKWPVVSAMLMRHATIHPSLTSTTYLAKTVNILHYNSTVSPMRHNVEIKEAFDIISKQTDSFTFYSPRNSGRVTNAVLHFLRDIEDVFMATYYGNFSESSLSQYLYELTIHLEHLLVSLSPSESQTVLHTIIIEFAIIVKRYYPQDISHPSHSMLHLCDNILHTLVGKLSHHLPAYNIDALLGVCDVCYYVTCIQHHQPMQKLLKNLCQHLFNHLSSNPQILRLMTANQICRLMFYGIICRPMPNQLLQMLEPVVLSKKEDISAELLSVIGFAFFKNHHTFSYDTLFVHFAYMLEKHIMVLPDKNIIFLLKTLRTGQDTVYDKAEKFTHMHGRILAALVSRIPSSIPVLATHAAALCKRVEIHNRDLFDVIEMKVSASMHNLRLKEISKCLECLGSLNYRPSDSLIQNVTSELGSKERWKEIMTYPASFITAVNSLSFSGLYSHSLLDIAFSEELYNALYTRYKESDTMLIEHRKNDLFTLCNSVGIECKDYTFVDQQQLLKIYQPPDYKQCCIRQVSISEYLECQEHKHSNVNKGIFHRDAILHCVAEEIKELQAYISPSLPHFYRLPDIFLYHGDWSDATRKSYNSNNLDWTIITILPLGSYCYKSHILRGHIAMKLRQLRLLNFTVVCIGEEVLFKMPRHERKPYVFSQLQRKWNSIPTSYQY